MAQGHTSTREESIVGDIMLPSACSQDKEQKYLQWVIPQFKEKKHKVGLSDLYIAESSLY